MHERSDVIVHTPRLILRRLCTSDAALIQPLADNWEVSKQTVNLPFPYGKQEARSFVDQALRAHEAGQEFVFAIIRRKDGMLMGLIGLVADVAPMETGYWLGQDYWGHGYASEALRAVLEYSRKTLCSRRLDAIVFEDNAASIRVLSKCGFICQERWEEDFACRGGVRAVLRYQWQAV
ncbi:MAG: GNAT family N-acetyltransferase [Alphaproteobacteria bacterium]|nr:GNAT family N-acetyltransferase [Alphaproteobacteria bacterium]